MTRITIRMRNEWRELAGTVPVQEIAERYGVADTTVYFHINDRNARSRREQWRTYRARVRAERRAA